MRGTRKKPAHSGLTGKDLGSRKPVWKRWKSWTPRIRAEQVLRASILVVLVGILTLLYPTRRSGEYQDFVEGGIAPEEVIAPEAFNVRKNKAEYEQEVAAARREILPVLIFDATLPANQEKAFNAFFENLIDLSGSASPDSAILRLKQAHPEIGPISRPTLRFLLNKAATAPQRLEAFRTTAQDILATIYASGVMEHKAEILEEGYTEAILIKDNKEQRVPMENIRDREEFILTLQIQEDIERKLPQGATAEIKTVYELVVLAYLTSNLTYNATETEQRRKSAEDKVSEIKGTVLKGERIVHKHDRVTAEHIDQLNSLVEHMKKYRQEDPYIRIVQVGAQAIFSGLIIAIFFGFLKGFRTSIYERTSSLVLFGIIILIPVLVAAYAATHAVLTPYIVPVALVAMLATVLFDAGIGLVISMISAVLCASILGSLQHSLVFLTTGVVGAYSVRHVLNRSDFYRSMVYLSAAYILTIATTGVLLFDHSNIVEFFEQIKWDLVFGVFTACASTVLTIGLLPIFESIFGVVTSITLLELSDLNRPLLRNLAIRSPGTYSHSIIMAGLSEAAADAIGADRLLVRVGCYYHDIGKMVRPHYFIENQKGINPHDELQPRMSALILISHVKEGVRLAQEEGLPRAIVDLIPQHHGTSEIASFKRRALERGDKQTVRTEDYRYPGPKPQTKEAGIINLADAVESATRTLSNSSLDQIRDMVQTLVRGRFTTGELDECDLTLRDLTRIQEAFLPILEATRHSRVPYPWQQQTKELRERKK